MSEHRSRRRFLRDTLTGVGGAAALSGAGIATAAPAAIAEAPAAQEAKDANPIDFTRGSSALQPTRTVRSACQFCNSLCALDVDLKDGRIIGVRGVAGDRVQHGEVCVKADLGSARLFLLFGTNQAETHPVTFAHLLRERQRRGARMVCIDPRQTATAAQADEWIAIKPQTDLALALGMLGHILANDLHDRAFVERWVLGFTELKAHVQAKGYTPEWAAERCDVPAAKIRALAEAYAKTTPAAIFCNAGISHQVNAFTTYRTLAILAAITGNIGVPGGGCNFMHNTWPGGLELPPIEGQTPARRDALPVGPDSFATAILDSQPYKLRAVITCGNPLLASANTEKVKRAYPQLELYVYTGLFREESALYADVLLPVTSGFETKGVYMRRDDRAIRWQEPAVPRVGESRTDWEIWTGIRPDTIFVPNGFGWEQIVGDSVGVPRYAEAANVLLDDRYFDTLSGQQAYKCFACRVRKA